MSKIYTRTGDKGKTSLYDGQRVEKTNPRIKLLGKIDLVTSQLGLAYSLLSEKKDTDVLKTWINWIQVLLQDLNSHTATTDHNERKYKKTRINIDELKTIENLIDTMEISKKPLKTFILLSVSPSSCPIHGASSQCNKS